MDDDILERLFLLREMTKKNSVGELERIKREFKEMKKQQELEDLKIAVAVGDIDKANEILEKQYEEEKKERKLERYRKMILGEDLDKDNQE